MVKPSRGDKPGEMVAEYTEDRLLGGRLQLRQAAAGYRAGLDAALLAASCNAQADERVLDAGCGVGAVMLQAAFRAPDATFLGVERDPAAVDLARGNVELNGLQDRVRVEAGEVSGRPGAYAGAFDKALANPPFFDDPTTLRGPAPAKRGAWLAEEGLQAWTEFLTKSVREGGSVILIHRADRLADLLALLSGRAGSFQARPVHPFADAPASRILIRAVRGGRAPLKLLPALVLHPRNGAKHTSEAEAILRGEAALEWL
ncbi:MAG TPA: methyltransferase [Caulobacteraceae bacterium]